MLLKPIKFKKLTEDENVDAMDLSHCNMQNTDCLGYDDHGKVVVIHNEPYDLWEYMEAFKDGCDLKTLIQRATALSPTGMPFDSPLLNVQNYGSGDISEIDPDGFVNADKAAAAAAAASTAFNNLDPRITEGLTAEELIEHLSGENATQWLKSRLGGAE